MTVKIISKFKYGEIEIEVLKNKGFFTIRRLRRIKYTETKMGFLKSHKEKTEYDILASTSKKGECDAFTHGLSFGYHLKNEKSKPLKPHE